MATVGAIIAIILTPILWLLYHKIFGVIYFGGVGRGIFKELFGCFLVSIIIVSVLGALGGAFLGLAGGLLSGLFSVIFFLLKWVLILGVIGGVIYLIYSLLTKKNIFGKKSENESSDEASEREDLEAIPAMMEANEDNMTSELKTAEINKGVIKSEIPENSHEKVSSIDNSDSTAVPDMKYCPFCGKKILWSQRFCKYCGKESSTNPSN